MALAFFRRTSDGRVTLASEGYSTKSMGDGRWLVADRVQCTKLDSRLLGTQCSQRSLAFGFVGEERQLLDGGQIMKLSNQSTAPSSIAASSPWRNKAKVERIYFKLTTHAPNHRCHSFNTSARAKSLGRLPTFTPLHRSLKRFDAPSPATLGLLTSRMRCFCPSRSSKKAPPERSHAVNPIVSSCLRHSQTQTRT